MKQTYIRCPRCELNYILKKDKFCNVCKMEMKALGSASAEDNLDLELCPVCKVNYINADEDMCQACAREREFDEDGNPIDNWENYSSQMEEDDDAGYSDEETSDMVSISNLGENPLENDDEIDLSLDDDDDSGLDDDDFDDDDEEEDDDGDDEEDDSLDADF